MPLVKAKLKASQGDAPDIEFMFNPKELSFEASVSIASNPGVRSSSTGTPNSSVSGLQPATITISNILFDTYESGEDVVEAYIKPFKAAVKFVPDKERPPIYTFMWGQTYLEKCMIEKLSYKLTKFLENGRPVRAVIDSLTLKEFIDEKSDSGSSPSPQPDRANQPSL